MALAAAALHATIGAPHVGQALGVDCVVLVGGDALEILDPVVGRILVLVVDLVTGRNWPVGSLPNPSVFKLLMKFSALGLAPLPIPPPIPLVEVSPRKLASRHTGQYAHELAL
jgi:hypothetical protein